MTAYSFGNKWMGIIALGSPPTAEPLHRMALRSQRRFDVAGSQLDVEALVPLLRRVRQRLTIGGDSQLARVCESVEQQMRRGQLSKLPSWLQVEIEDELTGRAFWRRRRSGSGNSPGAAASGHRRSDSVQRARLSESSRKSAVPRVTPRAAALTSIPHLGKSQATQWSEPLNAPIDVSGIPALAKPLIVLVDEVIEDDELRARAKEWVRIAQMHRSYHYERLRDSNLGIGVLDLLWNVGRAWFYVSAVDAARKQLGDFDSAAAVAGVRNKTAGESARAMAEWVRAEDAAMLGRGEARQVAGGSRSTAFESVALQIVGALVLATGSSAPSMRLAIRFWRELAEPDLDWNTLLATHLKATPAIEYSRQGDDHDATFTASFRDNRGRKFTGAASSKKAARLAAAKSYVLAEAPQLATRAPLSKRTSIKTPLPLSVSRFPAHAASLKPLREGFDLPVASDGLLSQALVHSSWAYENVGVIERGNQRDQRVLAAEGAGVAEALVALEHARATLSRGLAPTADDVIAPPVTEDQYSELFEKLGLRDGLLLSGGAVLTPRMKEDTVQAILAAAWRSAPDALTKRQPSALVDWVRMFRPGLDAISLLQRYCSSINLNFDTTWHESGPEHDNTYAATIEFSPVRMLWQGPSESSKKQAKASAAKEIMSTVLAQAAGELEDPSLAEQDIIWTFFLAELEAAEMQGPRSAARTEARRLGIDLLASGSLVDFARWASQTQHVIEDATGARDVVSSNKLHQRLRRVYSSALQIIARARLLPVVRAARELASSELKQESLGIDVRETAAFEMLRAFEALYAGLDARECAVLEVAQHCEVHTYEERGVTLAPGAASIATQIVTMARTIADGVSDGQAEIDIQHRADSSVTLLVRVPGVDLDVTLESVVTVAAALVPGIRANSLSGALSVTLPTMPKLVGPIAAAGVDACRDALKDEWVVELWERASELADSVEASTLAPSRSETARADPSPHVSVGMTTGSIVDTSAAKADEFWASVDADRTLEEFAPDDVPDWSEDHTVSTRSSEGRRSGNEDDDGTPGGQRGVGGSTIGPVVETETARELVAGPMYGRRQRLAGRHPVEDSAVIALVSALEAGSGRSHRNALADLLGVPVARFSGTLASLRRVLNVDGYSVIGLDADGETVRLDLALLREQFELDRPHYAGETS